MNRAISPEASAVIRKMQQNELTESVIYAEIARFAKGEGNRQTLLRLSREEKAHYEIWKQYTGLELKPEKKKVFKFKLPDSGLYLRGEADGAGRGERPVRVRPAGQGSGGKRPDPAAGGRT